MTAYYNEVDPFCCQWLRNLIDAGLIAPGVVDERSIADVDGAELAGFTQCHFFAGLGGWSLALRLAGWPDDRPVWTGSCPCQPFSAAGKGLGERDERHLWPEFRRLIAECRPAIVFGEQVASRAGRDWLAGVRVDLEGLDYAVGAADLCAAGVGAPHIRQRLWWVADADGNNEFTQREGQAREANVGAKPRREQFGFAGRGYASRLADADQGQRGRLADGEGREHDGQAAGWQQSDGVAQPSGAAGRMADADAPGQREQRRGGLLDRERPASRHDADGCGEVRGLADSATDGRQQIGEDRPGGDERGGEEGRAAGLGLRCALGPWSDYIWIECADGKARRIEPGLEPLAHGIPARVGRLRGYGNAIVPQVAAQFIQAAAGVIA